MKRMQRGFTLIEVLITVVIVGILTAVAVPAYSDYVLRGRLTDAFTALGGVQPVAEQYWANGRTYDTQAGSAFPLPRDTANFTYALSNAGVSSYTVTATGRAKMSGFVFTIDQNGTRATTAAPDGWGTSTSCWVDHKGGACSTN